MTRAIRLYRLKPRYYFTHKRLTVQGVETHAVIEESDGGSFWILRLADLPGWESTWQTYRGAKDALAQLIAGSLEPVMA